jgi:hypothetical protein
MTGENAVSTSFRDSLSCYDDNEASLREFNISIQLKL